MPTTNHFIGTVASLLVTIHQDERGGFSTSVEALPANPDVAQTGSLPAYASELVVESETVASTRPQGVARATRWWRFLIAAVTVAALVGAIVALHRSSRPSDPISSPATVPIAPVSAFTVPSANCSDAGRSTCSDRNTIPSGLGAACTDLFTTAAQALDEDPQQWAQTLLVATVRTGKPVVDEIREWLAGTRADVLATRYADVKLETILKGIDSAIALADAGTCAPKQSP